MDFLLYSPLHLLFTLYLLLLNYFPSTSNAEFDTRLFRQMTMETLGISFFVVQYISNFLEWLEDKLLPIIKYCGTLRVAIVYT